MVKSGLLGPLGPIETLLGPEAGPETYGTI